MQKFKSILLPMQGKNKSNLHWLYNERADKEEDDKTFSYYSLRFWFHGTMHRTAGQLILNIEIPKPDAVVYQDNAVLLEHFILGELAPMVKELSNEYSNLNKNEREKAHFSLQNTDVRVLKRSSIYYDKNAEHFLLRITFDVPLINATSINAKAALRAVENILGHIEHAVKFLDTDKLNRYASVYAKQQEIRAYLKSNGYCVFVANGSILPREGSTDFPMANAIPFLSPPDMCITIPFSDGTAISGMGIKQGITVIAGGGYSGKSTLLDAMEMGIYNHIPGDGREFVITDNSALKIYAEDGRPVHSLNISPFFKLLPNNSDTDCFSTIHASGSVSQAANIVEAVCGESKLLLIDEDKSAINFMVRDKIMRKIIKRDPVIPFTDRIMELYKNNDVSTILVIGGCSEYLAYADTVIVMNDYIATNITSEVPKLGLPEQTVNEPPAVFQKTRAIKPPESEQPFLFFRCVKTQNEKMIILDKYNANITFLTAITSLPQMNALSNCMEQLLTDKEAGTADVLNKIKQIIAAMFENDVKVKSLCLPNADWYEEIRPLDAFCCIHRMRGIEFKDQA